MSSNEHLHAPLAQELLDIHQETLACIATAERLDTPAELMVLEREHAALEYVQSQYNLPNLSPTERALAPITNPMHGVDTIGNQFAIVLMDAYRRDDPEEALAVFRAIEPNTTDQEQALLVNDEQFREIHAGLKVHLQKVEPDLKQEVEQRLDPKNGQIAINDRLQFNGNETVRSLRQVLCRGIEVNINESHIPEISAALEQVGTGPLPLTEVLKNQRLLTINGFNNSKISLAVHDAMDHTWGFKLLEEKGMLQKFSQFFDSIGNPAYTDIFRREGEIVASILFGVRYAAVQENGFVPLVGTEHILKVFQEYFRNQQLCDRHMEAFRLLMNMAPFSREWQSLGFVYSNYIAELNQQRRKHGKIKVRDTNTREVVGELSETDPDFLSLFVELHHEALSSKNKHRNDLYRYHILFEEYLQGLATGTIPPTESFNVKVQNLARYNYDKTTIPAERLRWMFKNYGFTATKDGLI